MAFPYHVIEKEIMLDSKNILGNGEVMSNVVEKGSAEYTLEYYFAKDGTKLEFGI